MLDKDQDGVLTEDDVMSVPADVVDEAFGQTPPGEVKKHNYSDPLGMLILFLGNYPPTPPLSQHFECQCWLRGGVGGQFPHKLPLAELKGRDSVRGTGVLLDPVYTGSDKFLNGQNLHGSTFRLNGTRGTVQVFELQTVL